MKRKLAFLMSVVISATCLLTACSGNTTSVTDSNADSQVTTTAADSNDNNNDSDTADNDDAQSSDSVVDTSRPVIDITRNEKSISFSEESGIFSEAFSLSLTSDLSEIYYTLDGSDPAYSDTAILYTGEISVDRRDGDKNVIAAVDPAMISGNFNKPQNAGRDFIATVYNPSDSAVDKCTTIRACAKAEDGSFTQTVTNTYFIGTTEEHIEGLRESCEAAGHDLAVISMTIDYEDLFNWGYGIYVKGNIWDNAHQKALLSGERMEAESARSFDANYKQKGREWERPCHIDFFEFSVDGAENVLSQDCGVRVQGNYSRSDWQKGLRLYARKDYGENNFKYAVFGDDYLNDAGEVMDKFKTLVLRAGGNCAFTAKFNDTYWQSLVSELACETKRSRPCVLYVNGEYFGLYVLEEDYTDDFMEDVHGVNKSDVVIYKGDAEALRLGYKLDEGDLPEGVTDESYYFNDLINFFDSHSSLKNQADYDEFIKLVDPQSVMDYFAIQVWINNKWDWPGKNWSMWRTTTIDPENEYNDGRWRLMFYDMEFGGVSGSGDCRTNTIKEDNYKEKGLLDMNTNNPAVLCFAYLMTNEGFREEYNAKLLSLSEGIFSADNLNTRLDEFEAEYSPLYDQFFDRYPGTGSAEEAVNGGYATIKCIREFINGRAPHIQKMVDWVNSQY